MSEYMEKHSVSRLVGPPPGYVGYEEGGQLTEAVRRAPYSVILFDEIEKAHEDVFNMFLQILDDGRLTDNKSLDKEEIKKIIDIFMKSLSNRLKDKDINMEVTDAAKDIMVREGYDPVYGARPLKRYIGNTLETIIARKLIAGQIRNGDTIVVDGDGDNIDIVVK